MQLKRFDFDYETLERIKLNNRVVFPFFLDMNAHVATVVGNHMATTAELMSVPSSLPLVPTIKASVLPLNTSITNNDVPITLFVDDIDPEMPALVSDSTLIGDGSIIYGEAIQPAIGGCI